MSKYFWVPLAVLMAILIMYEAGSMRSWMKGGFSPNVQHWTLTEGERACMDGTIQLGENARGNRCCTDGHWFPADDDGMCRSGGCR